MSARRATPAADQKAQVRTVRTKTGRAHVAFFQLAPGEPALTKDQLLARERSDSVPNRLRAHRQNARRVLTAAGLPATVAGLQRAARKSDAAYAALAGVEYVQALGRETREEWRVPAIAGQLLRLCDTAHSDHARLQSRAAEGDLAGTLLFATSLAKTMLEVGEQSQALTLFEHELLLSLGYAAVAKPKGGRPKANAAAIEADAMRAVEWLRLNAARSVTNAMQVIRPGGPHPRALRERITTLLRA